MLPTLENNEQFKNEFNDFKSRINKITNESLKKTLNDKLTNLLREVRTVDQSHENLLNANQISPLTLDSRNKIKELRILLTSRLAEWEKSQNERTN
jgi:hypothetical protein